MFSWSNRFLPGLALISALSANPAWADSTTLNPYPNGVTGSQVQADYREFYSNDSLYRMGIAYGIGLGSAATIDKQFSSAYQDHIRSSRSDDLSRAVKNFGEWKFIIPASLAVSFWAAEPKSALGQWGNLTFRTVLTGGPAVLLMQEVTGASRPNDNKAHGANWRPFKDNNGVSGHAFVGAAPFLALANLQEPNSLAYYAAMGASFATAVSRVNDHQHYLSQIGLGWFMAYEANRAVNRASASDSERRRGEIRPFTDGRQVGLLFSMPLP